MTPSFSQPTQEDRNVLSFSRGIRFGLLLEILVVNPEWITPGEVTVPQASDMEVLMSHLSPGHPRLPPENPIPYTVPVPWASLPTPSLVHPLMVSPFLAPATTCHMMHAKDDAVGMTQRVAPFLSWLRASTVDPQ